MKNNSGLGLSIFSVIVSLLALVIAILQKVM